jgi:hypothetical protein
MVIVSILTLKYEVALLFFNNDKPNFTSTYTKAGQAGAIDKISIG